MGCGALGKVVQPGQVDRLQTNQNGLRKTEAEVLSLQCLLISIIFPHPHIDFHLSLQKQEANLYQQHHTGPLHSGLDWGFGLEEWADDEKGGVDISHSFHVWL